MKIRGIISRSNGNWPANVDPRDNKLVDAEERARLAKVFEAGLHKAIGFVLPIGRRHEAIGPVWLSSIWPLRQEYIFLSPGDGPIGYRLPLMSLPWVDDLEYPYIIEQDPFDERGPLPSFTPATAPAPAAPIQQKPATKRPFVPAALKQQSPGQRADVRYKPLDPAESAAWVIRTAICVEPRNGKLYVFMPPFERVDDWLELVSLVEETAVELDMPVIIEGYGPPRDPRLNVIAVTPDPGVIEVNVHPTGSWDDLSRLTLDLYAEARLSRLGSEKFMIDGRHVGTGGGNHIVVGGATAGDSPFLRRPDVLRSLINYWQNHPALSYLFSGLFIGPTSQAPRMDEARNDSLYELEIAFKEIARAGPNPPPWADRPGAAQHPDRRAGQYAPRRILHRQALFTRQHDRPAGPGRAARFRNAAPRGDEPGSAIAGPFDDRVVLEPALRHAAGPLGHRPA